MSDHIDRIRFMNTPPERATKTATQLANEGKCCGNCDYWSHFKFGRCKLKDKHVSSFNICERHAEAK